MTEQQVLDALRRAPASGGTLLERLAFQPPLVVVYGALANLAAQGKIVEVARGPGERVWAVARTSIKPKDPGLSASFSLTDEQIGLVDKTVGRITAGLPQHYFEELRRAVIARSDRRGQLLLDELGAPREARRYLRRVEQGKRVKLKLTTPSRWPLRALVLVALVAAVRFFVIGVYTVPPESISMAPALIPAAEGGDRLVLASLLAGEPKRGDVWIFDGQGKTFVKRAMGLPGETIEIKQGDLFVHGVRLIKDRALLDRMAVPLPWTSKNRFDAHAGFVRADGSVERIEGDCRDVIVSGRIKATKPEGTFTVLIEEAGAPAHALVLRQAGFAAASGLEFGAGSAFMLRPGKTKTFWFTNADHFLRVEIDGKEVAKTRVVWPGVRTVVTVSWDVGAIEVEKLEVARDVIYGGQGRWELGPDEYLFLGDNSANSRDSRHFGPVSRGQLKGRVFAVVWPPARARKIK